METNDRGRIIRGIAGFYYVYVPIKEKVYECKAKGIFRNRHIKPLVGDEVEIRILSEEEQTGNIEDILERKKALIRPAVANIDQALVIFALADPDPNLNLLDRFLIQMERQEVPAIICFNKKDLSNEKQMEHLRSIYEKAGYQVLFVSAKAAAEGRKEEMSELMALLRGKLTTVAGPSGAGKSSIVNLLQQEIKMETGEVSHKIGRGRHTTRHAEVIPIGPDTYICDTPGFSSVSIEEIEKEDLQRYFREIIREEPYCRFQGCAHIHEPDCGVKDALQRDEISKERYENYVMLYNECKNKRRY